MENPTCIVRLVQFAVVAVVMQPRFHHIHQLNEVTVGPGCSVGDISAKWLKPVRMCAFYSYDEGI